MILTTCPSKSELRSLTIGELAEDQSDEIFDHLRDCPHCEQQLTEIDTADDTLIRHLQDDTDDDRFGIEPECQLAVAKALGSLASSQERRDDSRQDLLPDTIGEYEIVRPIGRGGMSSVYLARHAKLGREVAVKVLSSHRLAEPRTLERFNTEMRMVGSLTHPNIVTAFDAREVDGVAVLVTEYIDGFDAGAIVRRLGAVSLADSCAIGAAICKALTYVNAQGMVHRDVKPSNVMISRDGDIKLLDLGLARFHDPDRESADVTATGQAMGTADYIAPEQVNDSRSVDIRADVYALGCTLFKLLSGSAPFEDEEHSTIYAKLNAHVAETPRSLADVAPHVPATMAKMVDRMIEKDPQTRLVDLDRIVEQLEKHARGSDLQQLIVRATAVGPRANGAQPSTDRLEPAPKGLLRRRVPVSAVIAGFLAGGVLGLVMGIIITIQRPDGSWYSFSPPANSHTDIDEEGNAKIKMTKKDGGGATSSTTKSTPGGAMAAAPELQGIWRVNSSKNTEPNAKLSLLFYDDYFYLFQEDKPVVAGRFETAGDVKRQLTIDVHNSVKPDRDLKGVYSFSRDGSHLQLVLAAGRRPNGLNDTSDKTAIVLSAERIIVPDDPQELMRFTQKTENFADLTVITAFHSMKNGLAPADPNHPLAVQARSKVASARSRLNLKKIGLAFHNFHDVYRVFPSSAGRVVAKQNENLPAISWRVAILPFAGHPELYNEYRQDEPWDSEHNKTLLAKMPQLYRHSSEPQDSTTTCYVGFVGENSLLGKSVGRKMSQITDGTSNSLMIVESKTSIPWTKPEDLTFDGKLPQILPFQADQILGAMADGRVIEMSPIDTKMLGDIITINGGEPISLR